MKTKISKRLLSLFLSLLMIVTTVPAFAFTASAATPESYLVGSYLSVAVDSAFNTTGNVTWDNTEQAVKFEGGSNDNSELHFKTNPFASCVDSTTGFTISLDVRVDSDTEGWGRIFDIAQAGDDTKYFFLNGSQLRLCYKDGSSEHSVDPSSAPMKNNWFNVMVAVNATQGAKLYINGNLEGTTDNGNLANVLDLMSTFDDFQFGGSVYGDPCFKGYIRNLKLYNTDLTYFATTDISDAIAHYEKKMASGVVYTNMPAAYSAYIAAVEARDAVNYGTADSSLLTTTTTALVNAINAMMPWTPFYGTSTAKFQGTDVNSDYYANVIYTDSTTTWSGNGTSDSWSNEVGSISCKLAIPNTLTLLYNGYDSYFPVRIQYACTARNASKDRHFYTAADSADDLEFRNYWVGLTTTWNGTFAGVTTQNVSYLYNVTSPYSNTFTLKNSRGNITTTACIDNRCYITPSELDFNVDNNTNEDDYVATIANVSVSTRIGATGPDDAIDINNSRATIKVINYKALVDKIDTSASKFANVADYREGGLASCLNTFNSAITYNPNDDFSSSNAISTCNSNIAAKIASIDAIDVSGSADVNASKYQKLRDIFDGVYTEEGYEGLDKLGNTLAQSVADGGDSYNAELYASFITAYNNAKAAMTAVYTGGYPDTYNETAIELLSDNLVTAHRNLSDVYVPQPTVTGNSLLGPEDEITITKPSTVDSVSVKIGTNPAETYNDSVSVKPFENISSDTVVVSVESVTGSNHSTPVTNTYTYFKAPTFSVADNAFISADDTVTLTSGLAAGGTLQYSFDGENWVSASSLVPFNGKDDRLILTIYAREIKDGSTSAVSSVIVARQANLIIYSEKDGATSESQFYSGSTFYITNANSYTDTIYYTVSVDGGTPTAPQPYNKSTGISSSPYSKSAIVEIKAYSIQGSTTTIASKSFDNVDFDTLIYQESFDGASVSGDRFTTGTVKGVDGTIRNSGTVSVVAGAGDKHGNPSDSYVSEIDGLSADWRENVLKINPASSNTNDNSVALDRNPFASATTPIKNYIRNNGLSISFWRHYESSDGTASSIPMKSSGDSADAQWRNILYFSSGTVGNANNDYYMIMANGTNSYCKATGTDYLDYIPYNQDSTSNAAGNNTGYWLNIVLTIDPNSGITVYADGDPHEVTVSNGSSTLNGNNAAAAQDLINYLLDSNTNLYFNNSNNGSGWTNADTERTLYLDDIRFYAEPLRQVDIYNMYNDEDSDLNKNSTEKTKDTATSHDPTNVTVYTIAAGTYTSTDNTTYVAPAGKTVGIEFIEYYNVQASQILDIDYYSFGTGMTIYQSDDNVNWTVLGDSQGRCGYWNQDLFGGPMSTVLSSQQSYVVNNGGSGHAGAGNLVWAPHVMYNLTLNNWVMYAACSVWGTSTAVTFMTESSDGSIVHYSSNVIDIKKSSARPNVIDSCTIYGRNADETININQLYMSHGAWADSSDPTKDLVLCQLNADGTSKSTDNTPGGGDPTATYIATSINVGNNYFTGEGSYLYYNDGYYYLYMSFGENKGNYSERVFRTTSLAGIIEGDSSAMFKDYYEVPATNNSDNYGTQTNVGSAEGSSRGHQILNAHYNSIDGYYYTSTGHNSIYKAVNNDGEDIILNAAHARQLSGSKNNWKALEDVTFSTRQVALTGNVTIINPVVQTDDGWPLLLPYQYNGTDKTSVRYTIDDICGVYRGSDFESVVGNSIADSYRFTITKPNDDADYAFFCGTRANGDGFNYRIKLVQHDNHGGHTHLYMYAFDDETFSTPLYTGTFGQHTENGVDIPEFGMCSMSTDEHFVSWGYKVADNPKVDRESAGDIIHHSGIIYTHKSGDNYGLYGREISDNFTYGTENQVSSERYTSFTCQYPYYIDTDSATAIYSVSGEKYIKRGFIGDSIYPVDIYGVWYDKYGNEYTDKQAATAYANDPSIVLTKKYGLTGFVSSYFMYDSEGPGTGYPETGVTILVNYTDKRTGDTYGEYEFLYVMPNPEWAHEVVAIRNTNKTGVDVRIANATYSRFVDSEGSPTGVISSITNGTNMHANISNDFYTTGTGNYKYVASFGDDASINADYTKPETIRSQFNFFDNDKGLNGGSYACMEHSDRYQYGFGLSSEVINATYYIDYSDTALYGNRIRVDSNGVPLGYTFDLRVSNLFWNPKVDPSYATSYARNTTGLNVTYSSSFKDSSKIINTLDEPAFIDFNNEGSTTKGFHTPIARSDSGAYAMLYNDGVGFHRAFTSLPISSADTNTFTGTVTFTGKDTVNKNTDTSSAENLANYILETSLIRSFNYTSSVIYTYTGYTAEENYMYYNIAVNTCDKGAVRDFLDKFSNKQLTKVYDSNQNMYLAPNGGMLTGDYTVASYNDYLEALAEAYFFLENPHNTTYNGTGDNATAANDEFGEHQYSVGYRTAGTVLDCTENIDGTGNHYTVDRSRGSAIYDTTDLGTGMDIFEEGNSTETDPVQTRLIDNIVEAYFNLFEVSDYEAAQTVYADAVSYITAIDGISVNPETNLIEIDASYDGQYTETSIQAYLDIINDVNEHFAYVTGSEHQGEDDYWRYVELSGKQYKQLLQLIQELKDSTLMPLIETQPLDEVLDVKQPIRDDGIFDGDTQESTFNSWAVLNAEVNKANDLIAQKDVPDSDDFLPGKFEATTKTYIDPSSNEEYKYQIYGSEYSTVQQNIYDEVDPLSLIELVPVDNASAYQNFDSAVEVISTLDRNKYDAEGLALIDSYMAQFNTGVDNGVTAGTTANTISVYASATDVETYNANVSSGNQIVAGTKLKCTTTDETDGFTTALLELLNSHIKMIDAYLVVQDTEGNVLSQYVTTDYETVPVQSLAYGSMFNLTVPDLPATDSVYWSVSVYGNGYEDTSSVPTASQKVSCNNTATLIRKADSDVIVTAVVVKGEAPETNYKVIVNDIYGKMAYVEYVSSPSNVTSSGATLTINSTDRSNPVIPFWTITGWTISTDEATKTITVDPVTAVRPQLTYTLLGATQSTINTEYDKRVRISADSSVGEFAAWAIKDIHNQYHIVSYSSSYYFNSVVSQTYVAVVKNADGSYSAITEDGKETLTPSNTPDAVPESNFNGNETLDGLTRQQFLNKKLDNKAPFVYIEYTVDGRDEGYVRAYARITQGANDPTAEGATDTITRLTGYGVYINYNGSEDYKIPCDNVLDSGQYIVTVRTGGASITSFNFKGYVTYDFAHSFDGNDYPIAAIDTTANVNVLA